MGRTDQADGRIGPALVWENERGVCGDHRGAGEDELGVEAVAGRLVNLLSGEAAGEAVLVIVIGTDGIVLAVGSQFLLLVEHDKLRALPWFAGLLDPSPHLVVDLVKAATDEIRTRLLGGNRR